MRGNHLDEFTVFFPVTLRNIVFSCHAAATSGLVRPPYGNVIFTQTTRIFEPTGGCLGWVSLWCGTAEWSGLL
jgi:hypothetical protein